MQPFVVHAHFSQPERASPWAGCIDAEPSAAPDPDWNERMLRTSYRPNAAGRIFDEQRRVQRIVNNFERLSFDVSRSLLDWLERRAPRTYARVLDGDWRSGVRTGHGNALASTYDQVLLPLLNPRDRRTQIRWGIADFRHRFARAPEGFWLPEMACTPVVLDDLIDAGITFTILSPGQVQRVRPDGASWVDRPDDFDPSRIYRHLHRDRSGRSLAVAFTDDTLAQKIAFDPATADASVLLDRIADATVDKRGMAFAALAGETFGYHHPLADLGLAYALFEGAAARGLEPTNIAAWVADHPPNDDVAVPDGEGCAWSCTHGLGRWLRDCGCADQEVDGWTQQWREPLREALHTIQDTAAAAFLDRGGELLRDPWRARDDYIGVRLGDIAANDFLDRHATRHLSDAQKVDLWAALALQRYALLLESSSAFSAADISAPETVAVLRYAGKTLDLLGELGMPAPVDDVLEMLGQARSNLPEHTTAADIWRDHVDTARVTPTRVAAHTTLRGLVEEPAERGVTAGHVVSLVEFRAESRGRVGLATSRVVITAESTGRWHDLAVAAVHLGGLDFYGVVGPFPGDEEYASAVARIWKEFPTAHVAALIKSVTAQFSGEEFGLEAALPEGRQAIVGSIFSDLEERFGEQYARLYVDHQRILEMLSAAGYELPRNLRAAAELTLSDRLERQLEAAASLGGTVGTFSAIRSTLAHARAQGYQLELAPVRAALTTATTDAAAKAAQTLRREDAATLSRYLALAAELEVDVDLAEAQEHIYDAAVKARKGRLLTDEVEVVAVLGTMLELAPSAWGASDGWATTTGV